MIEAITFDFWDTIAIDDSDEERRRSLGLPSKAEARTQLFAKWVTARYPRVTAEAAREGWQAANDRFRAQWHGNHHTPAVAARIADALDWLGLLPPAGCYGTLRADIDALAREIEVMEVRIPPTFAPGVVTALYLLSQEYRLGIISDTIHTHGRGLRHLLGTQGLLGYFSALVFSDEVGAAKPSPLIFRAAAAQLDLPPSRMVHVGDRESNDIVGPRNVGMRAILFTGIVDRSNGHTTADAICRHWTDLPELIRRLR
jgi:putative hydrolase of the HAD superfamily